MQDANVPRAAKELVAPCSPGVAAFIDALVSALETAAELLLPGFKSHQTEFSAGLPAPMPALSLTAPPGAAPMTVLGTARPPTALLPLGSLIPSPTQPIRRRPRDPSQLRRRRRPGVALAPTSKKTPDAMITDFARHFRTVHGAPDREAAERLARLLKVSLRPRVHRGPDAATLRAARMRLAGKEWAEIYAALLGGRWVYRRAERDRLNRNTNLRLKKQMRWEGAPKGLSVPDWLRARQKPPQGTATV